VTIIGLFDRFKTGNATVEKGLTVEGKKDDAKQLKEFEDKARDAVAHNHMSEAVKYYDKALKIDPRNAQLWNLKGIVLTQMNQYPVALTCFEKAIEIDPQYPEPWGNKGHIFVNSGKWDDAVSCCNQALALSQQRPLGSASIEAHVWVTKGNALLYSFKFKEALDSFEKARELEPQNALAQQGIRQAREVMSQVGI
jgi:tetratricopeptide (TPR) repeat protein